MTIKAISLFAGVGGICLGFKSNGVEIVYANDVDKYACQTYRANFSHLLFEGDIKSIDTSTIPDADILLGGSPCQAFSIAGYRKGFEDDRGNMFFQIMRLVDEMASNNNKPRVIFLENVKNLKTHDKGHTFDVIKEKLEEHGYYVTEKVLNTCEYGNLPQNRERIFIVGFLNKKDYDNFKWPNKIALTKTIDKVVDWDVEVDKKYLYGSEKKCYDLLRENITEKNTIYQYRRVYVRANKGGVCPTLTANMGMGGHNVPLIINNQNKIRKLLPIECLKLQGFPDDFIIPSELCDSRVYKQAGNAVSVNVVKRVASNIKQAMEETDNENN